MLVIGASGLLTRAVEVFMADLDLMHHLVNCAVEKHSERRSGKRVPEIALDEETSGEDKSNFPNATAFADLSELNPKTTKAPGYGELLVAFWAESDTA